MLPQLEPDFRRKVRQIAGLQVRIPRFPSAIAVCAGAGAGVRSHYCCDRAVKIISPPAAVPDAPMAVAAKNGTSRS